MVETPSKSSAISSKPYFSAFEAKNVYLFLASGLPAKAPKRFFSVSVPLKYAAVRAWSSMRTFLQF